MPASRTVPGLPAEPAAEGLPRTILTDGCRGSPKTTISLFLAFLRIRILMTATLTRGFGLAAA